MYDKVGTGKTKQEAKNNAARDIVTELEKIAAQEVTQQRVIGASRKIRKNAVALLHEFIQRHKLAKPSYQVLESPGGSRSDYLLEVCIGSHTQQGRGSSKKIAKLACSKKMYAELKLEILGEEGEEEEGSSESGETMEEGEEEKEEEFVPDYHYTDLDEFQGSVRSRIVSEYEDSRSAQAACFAPVNIDNLPNNLEDLKDLKMTESQVIEDTSDTYPVPYEIRSDWRFASILLEKASQLGDIDVTFQKLKDVDDFKRSFLTFLTIKPKQTNDRTQQYLNMSYGVTLEIATETLAFVTLRHAEILDCNLSELVQICPGSSVSSDTNVHVAE